MAYPASHFGRVPRPRKIFERLPGQAGKIGTPTIFRRDEFVARKGLAVAENGAGPYFSRIPGSRTPVLENDFSQSAPEGPRRSPSM